MDNKTTAHNPAPTLKSVDRLARSVALLRRVRIYRSQLMRHYTDWKIGATDEEKALHKTSPSIVLSFDDFGSPTQIERVLGILASEGVRAVFFIQGDWAEQNPTLTGRITDQGHFVGNHTYSHPDLLALTDDEVRGELERGIASWLVRPPRGRYNRRIREIAASLGLAIAYWSIDSDDWQGVSVDYMTEKIMRQLHPGAVILFHLHADNTATLLPQLIPAIRSRGYDLLSFEEPFARPNHV